MPLAGDRLRRRLHQGRIAPKETENTARGASSGACGAARSVLAGGHAGQPQRPSPPAAPERPQGGGTGAGASTLPGQRGQHWRLPRAWAPPCVSHRAAHAGWKACL
ncbi:unnamed protein product, partial [Prorocentrum cordatum]